MIRGIYGGLWVVLALWPLLSFADESTPLLYTRTTLNIVRKTPPPLPALPWQAQSTGFEQASILFDVEVRDALTLYNQKGWFNLSSPDENYGVLMPFSVPGIAPVTHMSQYAPLDILFIDAQGKIIQIIPNITLSDLQQEIMPESPILAFLFLKGGLCEKRGINPGDVLEYKIFKKPPAVLKTMPSVVTASAPASATPQR